MVIPVFNLSLLVGELILAGKMVESGLSSKNKAGPVVLIPTALVPIPTISP